MASVSSGPSARSAVESGGSGVQRTSGAVSGIQSGVGANERMSDAAHEQRNVRQFVAKRTRFP